MTVTAITTTEVPDYEVVDSYRHVRVGQRYRITEQWAATMLARGCCPIAVAARRAGGIVRSITVSKRWGWDSIIIALDNPVRYEDGSGHGTACLGAAELEAVWELEVVP